MAPSICQARDLLSDVLHYMMCVEKLTFIQTLNKQYSLRLEVAYVHGVFNNFPDFFFFTGIQNCRKLLKIQYLIAIHHMR